MKNMSREDYIRETARNYLGDEEPQADFNLEMARDAIADALSPYEITEVLGDDITDADAEIFRKVIADD